MSTVDSVRELVEPVVDRAGLELVEVEHKPGLLRITLDRETGIDLDAITEATQQISDLLDTHDPIPGGRYTLEVTSPGVERPLRTPDQFRRFVGTTVSVRTRHEVDGERRFQGTLEAADDSGVVVDGRRFGYADIDRARTVFEWGPTPKPGSSRGKKAAR